VAHATLTAGSTRPDQTSVPFGGDKAKPPTDAKATMAHCHRRTLGGEHGNGHSPVPRRKAPQPGQKRAIEGTPVCDLHVRHMLIAPPGLAAREIGRRSNPEASDARP